MNMVRKVIESTYQDRMTVTEHRKITDEKTKLTKWENAAVLENQPCRLSFETVSPVSQGDNAAEAVQIVKLFTAPETEVKPGSKITVTRNGTSTDYACSGVPALYTTHQEIMLKLFERWS